MEIQHPVGTERMDRWTPTIPASPRPPRHHITIYSMQAAPAIHRIATDPLAGPRPDPAATNADSAATEISAGSGGEHTAAASGVLVIQPTATARALRVQRVGV